MKQQGNKRLAPANEQPSGGGNRYCPNCGTLVIGDETFCPNCGYKLTPAMPESTASRASTAPTKATKPAKTAATTANRHPRQPWSKKKKWTWSGIGIVAVLLVIFGVWGSQHYSRAATLDRTIADIKSGHRLTNDFSSDSSSLKLNSQKLLPVNRYYRDHAQALNQLKQALLTNGRSTDGHFAYLQRGHRLLFFPNYQIVVTPVYPKVTTNHTGNVINLDHQTVATANSDEFTQTLPALVPGEYHLQATGKIGGKQLTNSGDYHITSSKTYDLKLTTISVDLRTVPASAIYLNGKKIGTADTSGVYTLTNEPWSSDMAVYGQYTSNEGTATTSTKNLQKSDDQGSVDLDYHDMISEGDASDFFDQVANCEQGLSIHEDTDDATDDNGNSLSDYFLNGSANSNYSEIYKMCRGFYDDDALDSIDVDNTVQSVKPGPNKTSLVTFKTEYDFGLSDEDYDHVQTFQYTATLQLADADSSQTYQIVKITNGQKLDDYHSDTED